jgi:hypothetical protein
MLVGGDRRHQIWHDDGARKPPRRVGHDVRHSGAVAQVEVPVVRSDQDKLGLHRLSIIAHLLFSRRAEF